VKRWIRLGVLLVSIQVIIGSAILFGGMLLSLPPEALVKAVAIAYFLPMVPLAVVFALDEASTRFEKLFLKELERLDLQAQQQGRWTWNPFQSSTLKEIFRHMTPAERTEAARRGALMVRHLAVTVSLWIPALLVALTIESPLLLPLPALGAAFAGAFATRRLAPLVRGQKARLCSTEWSRAQGLTPERLHIVGIGGSILSAFAIVAAFVVQAVFLEWYVTFVSEGFFCQTLAITWGGEPLVRLHPWSLVLLLASSFALGVGLALMLRRPNVGAKRPLP
jgi:hypothetical protein